LTMSNNTVQNHENAIKVMHLWRALSECTSIRDLHLFMKRIHRIIKPIVFEYMNLKKCAFPRGEQFVPIVIKMS
jgi:hypothetical protein